MKIEENEIGINNIDNNLDENFIINENFDIDIPNTPIFSPEKEVNEAENILNDNEFEIIVKNSRLIKAFARACGIIERRNTMPILANLMLDASIEGRLSITATDMDIMYCEVIEVNTVKTGKITAPALMMHEIFRKFSDNENIHFKLTNNNLNITINQSIFDLPTLPVEQFPLITNNEVECSFKIKEKDLANIIDKTRFAICNEESRYYLNGVYLHAENENNNSYLKAASTDLHRLSFTKLLMPENIENMPGIILPKKTIFELRKIIDGSDREVKIEVSNSKAIFKVGHTELVTKLIDGNFPEYESVIPKELINNLRIDAGEFAKAVDRVAIFANDKSKSVKLELKENKMIVHSGLGSLAKGREEVTITDYNTKEELQIGFNARYLLDMLSVIKGDWLQLSFNDEHSAFLAKDEADVNSLYIIMPIRV